MTKFWDDLERRKQADPWFDVFPESQVKETISRFEQLFSALEPARYVHPTEEVLGHLMDQLSHVVPAVGFKIDADRKMSWSHVDFRHVLYAGWVTVATHPSIPFTSLNRLCEHAIMQQRAIKIEIGSI